MTPWRPHEEAYEIWRSRGQWLRAAFALVDAIGVAEFHAGYEDSGRLASRIEADVLPQLDRAQLAALDRHVTERTGAEEGDAVCCGTLNLRRIRRQVKQSLDTAPPSSVWQVGSLLVPNERSHREALVFWLRQRGHTQEASAQVRTPDQSGADIAKAVRIALSRQVSTSSSRFTDAQLDRLISDALPHIPTSWLDKQVIDGRSMELSVALHVWLQLAGLHRPARILATGRIGENGTVESVGKLPWKLAGVLQEAPEIDALVIPASDGDLVRRQLKFIDDPEGTSPRLILVETFTEALEALGARPTWTDLLALARSAEHWFGPHRRFTRELLDEFIVDQERESAPNPTWGDARLWRARLLRGTPQIDELRELFSQIAHALSDTTAERAPAAATRPDTLASVAATLVERSVDHLDWAQVDRVPDLLVNVPLADQLWPELSPAPAPQTRSAASSWLRACHAPSISRLLSSIGHAQFSLDRLDCARRSLSGALGLASPDTRARILIHMARAAIRSATLPGHEAGRYDALAEASALLVRAKGALEPARQRSQYDRSATNLAIVQYRLNTERLSSQGAAICFEAFSAPPGVLVHSDDEIVAWLAELRRAWLASSSEDYEHRLERLRPIARYYAVIGLVCDALDLLAVSRFGPPRPDFDLDDALRDLLVKHGTLGAHATVGECLAGKGAPESRCEILWRLPYLS